MFVPHHDISANQRQPKMTSSSAAHQLLSLLLTAACLALGAASDDAKSIVMVEADPYVPLDTEKHLAALDDSDIWLVEFFSPMCGSCTDFKSTWAEVASSLNGQVCIRWCAPFKHLQFCWQVKLGQLDITDNMEHVKTLGAAPLHVRFWRQT